MFVPTHIYLTCIPREAFHLKFGYVSLKLKRIKSMVIKNGISRSVIYSLFIWTSQEQISRLNFNISVFAFFQKLTIIRSVVVDKWNCQFSFRVFTSALPLLHHSHNYCKTVRATQVRAYRRFQKNYPFYVNTVRFCVSLKVRDFLFSSFHKATDLHLIFFFCS